MIAFFSTSLVISALALPGIVSSDAPRTMTDYARVHGGGANMDVPRAALTLQDVERWARILNASEAQVKFMEIMFARFVERHNEFMDREAPAYLRLGREVDSMIRDDPSMASRQFLQTHVRLDEASARIRRQLTAIEHDFIASLEPTLAEEQIERLHILRLESSRRNCRTYINLARWANVELRQVWAGATASLETIELRTKVENILAQYEAALTRHVCDYADAYLRSRKRLTQDRIDAWEGRISTREESKRRFDRIMNENVALSQLIRSLHERTLVRVSQELPEDIAFDFICAAKEAAFRELYPDPYAIHDLFQAVAADEQIDDDMVAEIAALHREYDRLYIEKSRKLEDFCIEYGDGAVRGDDAYLPQLLRRILEPRLAKRDAIADEYVVLLKHLVGEDTLSQHLIARASLARPPQSPAIRRAIEEMVRRPAEIDGPGIDE